ncbi:MAG: hypothetical protein ACI9SP_000367 [Arenicella sp.]|jgi:hypothetical protein
MSYFRIIGVLSVFLFNFSSVHATSADKDLQRCASAALQERGQSAKSISVNNSGLTQSDLDHDLSGRKLQYRMHLANTVSGEDLGEVTCTMNSLGELVSAVFDR